MEAFIIDRLKQIDEEKNWKPFPFDPLEIGSEKEEEDGETPPKSDVIIQLKRHLCTIRF